MGPGQALEVFDALDHALLLDHGEDHREGAKVHDHVDREIEGDAAHPFLCSGSQTDQRVANVPD